jgi:hypothetical protein
VEDVASDLVQDVFELPEIRGVLKRHDGAVVVTVQVGQPIFLDKSRRMVYRMVDECDTGSPQKATRDSGESPSVL